MNIVIEILQIIISCLMWLKITELVYHMLHYYPSLTLTENNIGKEWPITSLIAKVSFIIPRQILAIIFRFKALIILLILVSIFPLKRWTDIISGITLFCALWIQLIRILVDQVKYGSDFYLSGNGLPHPLFIKNFGGKTPKLKLHAFLYLFLGLCASIVIGFGVLFYSTYCNSDGSAFNHDFNSSLTIFDFIYFSIVTFATVGYGDITPSRDILPRILVSSEIILSFLVIITFITSVSLTFNVKDTENGV